MNLTLITGGARAGKSTFAERLARESGGLSDVWYVATAEAGDTDMAARITAHRAKRPPDWSTLETPRHVAASLASFRAAPARVILVDCLTMLVSNVLLSQPEAAGFEVIWEAVEREVDGLLDFVKANQTLVIVVTNEVGSGVVPATRLGCIYRDLLGRANMKLAAAATDVYLVVAGIPIVVKSDTAQRQGAIA
ncbi:bifunctional adenosylcobinamide kinase/adenosylcobinamide-phosphate guanylyltransferase [Fimbriiglobus ruber]|uniref:Adenosylcobinamide kinase n=1 Tax=Fimbriiglobus ruber TaxID=1908690 RepID=A0A225DUI8_9BACT|nr:bifunctional adenosylcobinamide kinase/adenosylcobinamide-phosphate guanylyltransferase [Fimbriiglobus ruber]OWK41266.1 Adenosylcobinamide-phosphate guanylyltransferase [Fimbriiglobus ruber]